MSSRAIALYFCFFLSGSAALIYQIVWQRMLTLVMGVSSWSIAAVLTAYMAGLAIGAWAFGSLADRSRNVVRVYALVELGILVSGLVVSRSISPLMDVYTRLASGEPSGFYYTHGVRFVLALAVFVVPCILIGATIPLMSRIITRHAGALGVGFGRFYAVNTLGAVLGAGIAGFVLIRDFGMHDAVYFAGAGNLLAAIIALLMSRGELPLPAGSLDTSAAPSSDVAVPSALESNRVRPARALRLLAFFAGLTGLGYELAWSRLLAVYTLNSVYVFTMLLTVFLTGLALGSAIAARLMRVRGQWTVLIAGVAQLLLAMSAPIVLALTGWASQTGNLLQAGDNSQIFWAEYKLVLAIVFFPTLLLGASLPLFAGMVRDGEDRPGRSVGVLYAWNSLGSIVGAAVTGVVLVPVFGIRATLMVFAIINFACGAWLLVARARDEAVGEPVTRESSRYRALLPVAACVMLAISLLSPQSPRFLRPPAANDDAVLYYKEGANSIVAITMNTYAGETNKVLYVDSQSVAGDTEKLITDQKMLAHLPLLLVENPGRALTVGFGTGGTSYSMLLHDVETHCVEIERSVPAASRHFLAQNLGMATLQAGLEPARTDYTIILDDARSWLHLAPKPYDVIVDDLTSIQYRGNGNLYTKDCFELIRAKLTPEGVGCAWVPITGISSEALKMLTRTFRAAFPHTTVWYMANHTNDFVIFVGTPETLMIDLADWESRMEGKEVGEDLARVGLRDPYRLAACLLLDEAEVEAYCNGGAIHTDNRPLLDYLTHAGVYQHTLTGNLREMVQCRRDSGGDVPVSLGGVTPVEVAERWDLWRQAMTLVLEGHIAEGENDTAAARKAYVDAYDLIPSDPMLARFAGRSVGTHAQP